jgi:Na+/melibiose symporter-like transporter
MLTLSQKIGMTFALILACCVLAAISFYAGWENMPLSHKKIIFIAGYFIAATLAISSFILLIVVLCIRAQTRAAREAMEYNKAMEEQFDATFGDGIWIDCEDYRNFSARTRK